MIGETGPGESNDLPPIGLRVAGVVFSAVFLLGAILPRDPDLDAWFGVESYGGRLPFFAGMALLLLLVLFVPGAARRIADAVSRVAGRVPVPRLTATVAATALFLAVPNLRLSGDGTTTIWNTAAGDVFPSNALTSYLHLAVAAVPGVSAHLAVRLVGAAAGAVYVLAVVGIAREVFDDGPRRAALALLLLTTGSVALYFGAIEVYAPVCAAIGVYLLVGVRQLRGTGRAIWPPLVLGVAFAFHGSVGVLLPSLLLLANEGRLRPLRIRRWFVSGALFAVPVLVVLGALYFGTWGGEVPEQQPWAVGNFAGSMGQSPLLPLVRSEMNLTNRYALLDLEHLLGVLNLCLLAAPAGLAALLLAGRRGWRVRYAAWVASAAAFLVAFPVFWNVSYPLRRDWDLFSSLGIPLTLLGGLAFLSRFRGRTVATAMAALALFAFVPFVVANAGTRRDRIRYALSMAQAYGGAAERVSGERREEALREQKRWLEEVDRLDTVSERISSAIRLVQEGRVEAAERIYREVAAEEPELTNALVRLGVLLVQTGRTEEGREWIVRALRVAPDSYDARFALAWTHEREGGYDASIPYRYDMIRYATHDIRVLNDLLWLEKYWRLKAEQAPDGGAAERRKADAMRRMADARRRFGE